jgi:DNA-binding LacI/PurR family transcriptional regulator
MARVTILDVARAAGVSKGAVSHALNGRRGVSDETRQRVLQVARDLGWSPSVAARALSGSRAGAIGWAIVRTPKSSTIDPYFTELFAGIELGLAGTDLALVVKLVSDRAEEQRLYQQWAGQRRVDGVLLTDIDVEDGRFAVLEELGLPVAAFRSTAGGTGAEDAGAVSVWLSETEPVRALLDLGLQQGHRRIGWVSGDEAKLAVRLRAKAADEWQREHGAVVRTVYTDYGTEQGIARAVEMMQGPEPPTYLIFDNDLMAMGGLSACHRMGLRVPEDVSIASFIDSVLCSVAVPPITALSHPIVQFGQDLTHRLLDVLDGGDRQDTALPAPELVLRASVGAAPVRPLEPRL